MRWMLLWFVACAGTTMGGDTALPTDATSPDASTPGGTGPTGSAGATTPTDVAVDASGVLADPVAEGCHRFRYDPPDVLALEDHDAGMRLVLRGSFGGIGRTAFDAVDLTFDLSDDGVLVLEQLEPNGDMEEGCGSIEEVAPVPRPESTVWWSTGGRAVLTLAPDDEHSWMWSGTLSLEAVSFEDDVLAIDVLEVDAAYSSDPPA